MQSNTKSYQIEIETAQAINHQHLRLHFRSEVRMHSQSLCIFSPSFSTKPSLSLPRTLYSRSSIPKPQIHRAAAQSFTFNPLRFSLTGQRSIDMNRRRSGVVCYSGAFAPHNLQWACAVSAAILMIVKGTAIDKSYLVPLFALQAPPTIISWIQGEYGAWSAFLALLVRLFFFIPAELELPFVTLLLVIVAPYNAMKLRGTQPGAVVSLALAGYLAFQHFSRLGSLQKGFDQGSIVATLAIACITVVPLFLLF